MRRVLCVWLPEWSIQRRERRRPELRRMPWGCVAEVPGRGLRVMAASARAQRCGVVPGLPLAEARALVDIGARHKQPGAWFRDKPEQDTAVLRKLALACQRFSPLVSVEEADRPESLLLDITGCEPLFGGEAGLVEQLQEALRQRGYAVRMGVADTAGAAWALAHAGSALICRQSGSLVETLQPLPVAALRIPSATVSALSALGVQTVRDLLALPRSELPARLGELLLLRLDQALGHRPEQLTPERLAEPVSAQWSQEDHLGNAQVFEYLFQTLLSSLLEQLGRQSLGIQALQCDFLPPRNGPGFLLKCVRPTADRRHLSDLFRLNCERMTWPAVITGLRLEVVQSGGLAQRQARIFAESREQQHEEALQQLCERLAGRLGEQSVGRIYWQPDPQPEQAARFVPLWETVPQHLQSAPPPGLREHRPGQLLSTPQPVEVWSSIPDGPPVRLCWNNRSQAIARAWGPERIETGWWRGSDVRRDYYRVETDDGRQCWLFRDLVSCDWFLHGWFA